jgi:hypothetical protein
MTIPKTKSIEMRQTSSDLESETCHVHTFGIERWLFEVRYESQDFGLDMQVSVHMWRVYVSDNNINQLTFNNIRGDFVSNLIRTKNGAKDKLLSGHIRRTSSLSTLSIDFETGPVCGTTETCGEFAEACTDDVRADITNNTYLSSTVNLSCPKRAYFLQI